MADLPTGTVSFLFSDMEGSTRLLRQLREDYGELLATHRRILREAFAENRGQVVDMQGDAFFVVFPRARDAVAAAVAAQAGLARHDWPATVDVRVRIGVHTGEALLSDDGYLGLAVHRAARICAAGYGGQILLSQSTAAVLEDEEIPGVALRDIGEHRLKDIDRTEHVYQAVIEGAPDDTRPLKPLESQPIKATPFAGQERELAAAAQVAVASRRTIIERVREALERPPSQLRYAGSVFAEAVWESVRRPRNLLAVGVVLAGSVLINVWILAAGAAVYAYHVYATVLAVRFFHKPEGVGWKVHSMARIPPDRGMRDDFYKLAGALVRAGRVARSAEAFLADTDRRKIAHELGEARSTGDLERADVLARALRSVEVLVDRLRAFETETRRVDAMIPAIRERTFEARLDGRVPEDLSRDVAAFADRISLLGVSLADAFDEAARFGPRTRRRRLRARRRRVAR